MLRQAPLAARHTPLLDQRGKSQGDEQSIAENQKPSIRSASASDEMEIVFGLHAEAATWRQSTKKRSPDHPGYAFGECRGPLGAIPATARLPCARTGSATRFPRGAPYLPRKARRGELCWTWSPLVRLSVRRMRKGGSLRSDTVRRRTPSTPKAPSRRARSGIERLLRAPA